MRKEATMSEPMSEERWQDVLAWANNGIEQDVSKHDVLEFVAEIRRLRSAPAQIKLNNPHTDPSYPNLVLGGADNGQVAQPLRGDVEAAREWLTKEGCVAPDGTIRADWPETVAEWLAAYAASVTAALRGEIGTGSC